MPRPSLRSVEQWGGGTGHLLSRVTKASWTDVLFPTQGCVTDAQLIAEQVTEKLTTVNDESDAESTSWVRYYADGYRPLEQNERTSRVWQAIALLRSWVRGSWKFATPHIPSWPIHRGGKSSMLSY